MVETEEEGGRGDGREEEDKKKMHTYIVDAQEGHYGSLIIIHKPISRILLKAIGI